MVDEQQQYVSQPVTDREMTGTFMQEERIKNIISQISPDNQLAEIQMRLKGYTKDPITGQWQILDEEGSGIHPLLIRRYIGFLSSALNQNTTMSNLDATEINKLMNVIIEWITDDLDANSEIYGIGNDYGERTRVGNIILMSTFFCFKRAMNGLESRRIFSSLSIQDNLSGGNQKQGGLLENLKFWKK